MRSKFSTLPSSVRSGVLSSKPTGRPTATPALNSERERRQALLRISNQSVQIDMIDGETQPQRFQPLGGAREIIGLRGEPDRVEGAGRRAAQNRKRIVRLSRVSCARALRTPT